MKYLITGATGLVGQALCHSLKADGHAIVALSRTPDKRRVPLADEIYVWNPEAGVPPVEAFAGVEAVIHLAGESVASKRWSDEQKRRIRDSRVLGTRHLVTALQSLRERPPSFICASAVGYYGDRGDAALNEQSPAGTGFLSEVCVQWEREAERATSFGIRVVMNRLGVVLSQQGGAMEKMLPLFKLGIAGKLGSGRQWFPWIHLADVVGLFRHTIFTQQINGPVNLVAPGIVTNAEFTAQLAGALHRPAFFAAPEFGLKLAMGEMAAVVLASQKVFPKVALETGYRFHYSDLSMALQELLEERRAATSA